uniref:Bifunctional inhibitor/plant lipid transfer protein/seed storage helical domain-containing protein n=1 Tax=Leersia perrieri TaxID=77586 RepID=A0A0D9VTV2_9ORYZ
MATSSTRSLLLAVLLVATVIAPHGAEAGASSTVMGLVTGVVPCSAGKSINAAVMGGATADSTGAFTINMGALNATTLMPLLNNKCSVVVTTPLAACDASLAGVAGTLTAPLQLLGDSSGGLGGLGGLIGGITGLVGQILGGLLGSIVGIIPSAFSLV